MAVNSETRTFDQILSTTYDYYRPVLVDNIFKMNALFYKLYNGGKISHQDYMAQCDGFTASKYDPEAWAELFERAGAKYVVLTRHPRRRRACERPVPSRCSSLPARPGESYSMM